MTDTERLGAALAMALFAHFAFLYMEVPFSQSSHATTSSLTELETSSFTVQDMAEGVALESVLSPSAAQKAADKRRSIRQLFLEDVRAAVHARRFAVGDMSLIGVTIYSFIIDTNGFFSAIHMEQSSGKPALDRAAYAAIESASGMIKRPSALGDDEIQLILPIKYQYDLQ